ncbi:hypothetical protein SELMODRAFT_410468 [Selaginella moellendorffii]|uniref:DNA-binding protein RHL1 n=1 Tax=Selaginella moellendorffii TaxID=88036 RepID=D8REU9_SELML|nr:hypothetical protein SELMODRAFT_410468 [Selaginella moellendorffii]
MKHGASENPEQQAIQEESARLRNAAISRGLLGRSAASPPQLLLPSKELLKCDGKDIVKKGTRKSKFLFSFPGLVAPVAGGKFGDLAHLDTKNPILYVDFPKGRIKLFGTIVYPKNKYLTLQLTKGSKSVICDDVIESLVVFSESWWIGTKEENPEEKKLDMPKDLCEEKHTNYSFTAGAGSDSKTTTQAQKLAASVSTCTLKQSTLTGFQSPSLPEEPIRQSRCRETIHALENKNQGTTLLASQTKLPTWKMIWNSWFYSLIAAYSGASYVTCQLRMKVATASIGNYAKANSRWTFSSLY